MLHLAPIIGDGTRKNKFRPRGTDYVSQWSMLDLRDDAAKKNGWCLVWTPSKEPLTIERGIFRVAEDPTEKTHKSTKIYINSKLGIDVVESNNVASMLGILMFRQHKKWLGRVKRWNSVLAENWTGIRDVWIGGRLWARQHTKAPCLNDIDPSDSFIRANETPLAAPWTALAGNTNNINLATNVIQSSAAGDKFYYLLNAANHADQFSEFRQNAAIANDDWGAALRIGVSGFSGYWYSNYTGPAGESFSKFVSGTATTIATSTQANIANADVQRTSMTGSSLSATRNGVAVNASPQTDTSLTTAGNGVGVFIYDTGGGLNNFQGGNIKPGFPLFSGQPPDSLMCI